MSNINSVMKEFKAFILKGKREIFRVQNVVAAAVGN